MTIEQLIKDLLDPEELIDILGLTTEELVDILAYQIYDNKDKFKFLERN